MIRARFVAVESTWLVAQSQTRPEVRVIYHANLSLYEIFIQPRVQDDQKLIRVRGTLPVPHPAVMVTECDRHSTARMHARPSVPDASDSPHSLRATCTILPTEHLDGAQSHLEARAKSKRKRSYEPAPPAYWRPDSNQRGKCMGYALGYPGNWSVRYEGDPRKRWYVRDVMRNATFTA
jgi:hypothetical protein